MRLLQKEKSGFKEELKISISRTEQQLVGSERRLKAFNENADKIKNEVKEELREYIEGSSKKKARLFNEVLSLEKRKEEALKPLDGLRDFLKKQEKELKTEKLRIEIEEENNKSLSDKLEMNKRNLDKETSLIRNEKEMVYDDKENVMGIKKILKKNREDFLKIKERWREVRKNKELELSDRLSKVKDMEILVKNERQIIEDDRKAIKKDRRKLYSQQQTLKLAFKEYKKLTN